MKLKMKYVTVAGKCCESGDLIIKNRKLGKAEKGVFIVSRNNRSIWIFNVK